MKRNNRGFTLVEMIIATAILGIVIVGVFGFMLAGANSYRSVSTNVRLQTAAQQVMNQIQETVLDCDTAIYAPEVTGNELYLLNTSTDPATGDEINTISVYKPGAGTLDYWQTDVTAATLEAELIAESEKHTISDEATYFYASLDKSGAAVNSVTVEVTLTRQGKTYTGRQTIALRNQPKALASAAEILAAANS